MLLISSISFLVLLQITGVTTANATEPVTWSDTRFGGGSDTQFSSDGYADVTSISISETANIELMSENMNQLCTPKMVELPITIFPMK